MAEARAFDGVITHPLAGRLAKPRKTGQTMVIDKGLGLVQTADLMEMAAEYIDFVKLTFGTAALYPCGVLQAKVDLIRSHGVEVYPGGTFLEIAFTQNALGAYLQRVKEMGFTFIEVSDGTITLTPAERREAILLARRFDLGVVTEVGKKDGAALDPDEALRLIDADLEAGATKVIVEGREGGKNAGLYDASGQIRLDDLERLVDGLPDPAVLMWEAPLKKQQEELIARFGPNVSLGNIPADEVIALEALRCGLRSDTLRLALTEGAVVVPSW